MNRYLISVAALALMAAPALAQHEEHGGGRPGTGGGGAPHAEAPHGGGGAPHAGPPPGGGGAPHGEFHGGGGGGGGHHDMGGAMRAAPAPQPQAMRAEPQHMERGNAANRPVIGNANANRGDFHGRPDNRGAVANAPANRAVVGNANANRGGGFHGGSPAQRQQNFASFRDTHHDMRAPHRFHGPAYHPPSGYYARHWAYGMTLPALFWGRDYWLMDYGAYDLPPPPWGAVWVRVGPDALLIDQDDGEIITVYYGVFY